MARSARSGLLFLALLATACTGPFETVTELPKVPRRPDGVVLDRELTLPEVVERGDPAASLVALREPFDPRVLKDVVKAYFRAWEREDLDALTRMLTPDAVLLRRPGTNLVESFRTRMRTFEYQHMAGLEAARTDQIERFRYADLTGSARPPEMREDDLLVRVPVLVSRVGGDALFGDTLVLLLRREEGGVRVAGVAEESGGP